MSEGHDNFSSGAFPGLSKAECDTKYTVLTATAARQAIADRATWAKNKVALAGATEADRFAYEAALRHVENQTK